MKHPPQECDPQSFASRKGEASGRTLLEGKRLRLVPVHMIVIQPEDQAQLSVRPACVIMPSKLSALFAGSMSGCKL